MSAAIDYSHDEDEALGKATLRLLERACRDPAVAFDLVMREETSKERVRILPHQRVTLDFVMSHDRCVLRLPVGTSKTYLLAFLTLYFLGLDSSDRGAIISAGADQAKKTLALVRDYIEGIAKGSAELHAIFPKLWPSSRLGDKWTQSEITIEREAGIRDPSVTATGLDGKRLPGSRLAWIVVDDLLNRQNSKSDESRKAGLDYIRQTVLSRRDVNGSKIVVSNTPWHKQDVTYLLEKAGWPTLTMDIEGDIRVTNTTWTSSELRPSTRLPDVFRLVAHDSPEYVPAEYEDAPPDNMNIDEQEVVPLWPERYSTAACATLRDDEGEEAYNMSRRCIPPGDADQRVHVEWIEKCKENARAFRVHHLVQAYDGEFPSVTGVDIGIGLESQHCYSALVTACVLPSEHRVILDIDVGRYEGQTLVDKCLEKHNRYHSILRVENNAAQDLLLQWARADARRKNARLELPIRAHTTGANKADSRIGLESVFVEVEQGLWLFPNDADGRCPKQVQHLIDKLTSYERGQKRTADVLMALWFCREQFRVMGFTRTPGGRGSGLAQLGQR
jgi:hypothetical protein